MSCGTTLQYLIPLFVRSCRLTFVDCLVGLVLGITTLFCTTIALSFAEIPAEQFRTIDLRIRDRRFMAGETLAFGRQYLFVEEELQIPNSRIMSSTGDGDATIQRELGNFNYILAGNIEEGQILAEFGWPFKAFRCSIATNMSTDQKDWGSSDAIVVSSKPLKVIPYRPAWIGLLANVCLYMATYIFMILIYRFIRGLRRIRRSLCDACGYDIRMSQVRLCPECGSTLLIMNHDRDHS